MKGAAATLEHQLKELAARAPEHIRCRFQRRTYCSGVLILPASAPLENLCIIYSGVVEVLKESYSGTNISVNTFEEGNFFGEIEIFCPELTPYKVRAKTDCELILVPKDVVFTWMQEDFAVTHVICETLAKRLYFTSDSMSRIAMLPLKQRVLGCIEVQYRLGTLPTFTKQMLVEQTRAPLRSINRIVRDCIDEGIISYNKKTFRVLDSAVLSQYAKEYEI